MTKKETRMLKPELLAPAGNFEKLVTAIHYGADAVYCGGKRYSLRAHAGNFTETELQQAVQYAHAHGVKLYVTVNIIAHDRDFAGLEDYLRLLRRIFVDGIIISDPGVLLRARQCIPEMPLHLSTQANVTNSASAAFWHGQGVNRLNLARELTLAEIRRIKTSFDQETPNAAPQIEVFVHGALCISYSGRCLLSCYLTGRDANQGDCAHPCRYRYSLVEEKRPGQFFPVEEDERGTYIFNSKDLCLLPQLPELMAAGVDSVKIEGRMKGIYYVGAMVRLYRAAIDVCRTRAAEPGPPPGPLPPLMLEELAKVGTRGYTENFILGPPTAVDMIYDTPRIMQDFVLAGVVRQLHPAPDASGFAMDMEVRNTLKQGEQLEFLAQGMELIAFTANAMHTMDGEERMQANPGDLIRLHGLPPSLLWRQNGLVRKKNPA